MKYGTLMAYASLLLWAVLATICANFSREQVIEARKQGEDIGYKIGFDAGFIKAENQGAVISTINFYASTNLNKTRRSRR